MTEKDGFILFLCNLDNSYIDEQDDDTRKYYLQKVFNKLENERKKTESKNVLWCFYSNEHIEDIQESISEVEDNRKENSSIVMGKILCPSFDFSFESYNTFIRDGVDISKKNVFFYLNKYYNNFLRLNKVIIADSNIMIPDETLEQCFTCDDICLLNVPNHNNKLMALSNCFKNEKKLIYKEEHN